ncbi:MAG: nitronate monooxygenase [Candidatus Pseudobacter hemicellulosilyticus]|uniref:Propionate 3-nitronate monooxygenase n=1 Tax=Candidatus Pseudobacter hemicellulosilyticus TaxID=3121375 RepID=A0AAJ6BGL9_9BACT|nr:MAG: nitronate monooxygenase [Pseudobacter sp.]
MWRKEAIVQQLGIQYPILLGPFGGGFSTPQLTAAVSNAGGLGGYGAYTLNAAEIIAADQQIRQLTDKPYNLNLWVSDTDAPDGAVTDQQYEQAAQLFKPYFEEAGIPLPAKPAPFQSRFGNQLQAVLDIRPKVFSFLFGVPPSTVMEDCRRRGILLVGAATTLDEAIFLENAGVDMIIAAGFEAGGHRPSFLDKAENSIIGSFVLLQLIREKVKV